MMCHRASILRADLFKHIYINSYAYEWNSWSHQDYWIQIKNIFNNLFFLPLDRCRYFWCFQHQSFGWSWNFVFSFFGFFIFLRLLFSLFSTLIVFHGCKSLNSGLNPDTFQYMFQDFFYDFLEISGKIGELCCLHKFLKILQTTAFFLK